MKNYDKHHAKLLKHLSNNLVCPRCNKKANKVNKVFYRKLFYIKAKTLGCNCQKLFIIGDIYDNNNTKMVFGKNTIRINYFKQFKCYYFVPSLYEEYVISINNLNNKDLFLIMGATNFNLISNHLNKIIKVLYKIENNMLFY